MPKYRNKYGFYHYMPVEDECEPPSPEDYANKETLKRKLVLAFMSLQAREERLLRLHFGLGCEEHTLAEIAHQFGVGTARIGQIKFNALWKLRHSPAVDFISANNTIVYDNRQNWDEFEVRFGVIPYP